MSEPDEVMGLKGNTISRKMSVDEISFSAHVDYSQNSEFIEQVKAPHIVSSLLHPNGRDGSLSSSEIQVLVHGEQNAMGRLRAALQAKYKAKNEDVKIHMPRNLETLNLTFRGERVAKVTTSGLPEE